MYDVIVKVRCIFCRMAKAQATQLTPTSPSTTDPTPDSIPIVHPSLPSTLGSYSSPSTSGGIHSTPGPSPYSTVELVMFKKVIASGCTIQSQQRGEPDLTQQELCDALYTTLRQSPGSFLMRFGKYLDEGDLTYFDSMLASDFEVNFRVNELRENLRQSSKTRMKRIKNRRYQYLQQLMEKSTYFSEEEMRQREPLLFEYYIGQYLTEDEKFKIEQNKSEMTLSSMILKNMEIDRRLNLLREQIKKEQVNCEEPSSEDDEDQEENCTDSKHLSMAAMELSSDPTLAAREKFMMRQEFLAAMQANFLDGKDRDFDYSKVDYNDSYDSLDMKGKDEEDNYFDTEEPSFCGLSGADAITQQSESMEVDMNDKDSS